MSGASIGASPRFLADENIAREIVEGLRRKRPQMMVFSAAEAGTLGLSDLAVLKWAKEHDLILITHDRKTMYAHFATFLMSLQSGEHCPGILLISQKKYSSGQIIEFILEIYDLSSHTEWQDLPTPLPL